METNKRIIEINGVKLEIDLRETKVIEKYKVGDSIKVLVKKYSDSFESHIGTIIGFDNYEKTPTIVIAYLNIDYSHARIEYVYFNEHTKDIEICPLNDWDVPLTKSEVLEKFDKEIAKKEEELKEQKQKKVIFEKMFGKYFEDKE